MLEWIPNTRLYSAHTDIINRQKVICAPFEDLTPDDLGCEFDFILTSPPFFDREIYTPEATQSIARYSDIETWQREFL